MGAVLRDMSSRSAFIIAAVLCAGLLGFGYFLQYVIGLTPCPLCLVQRAFYYGVIGACAIGAIHGPRGGGARVYAVVALLSAIGGIVTAGRQVWLQHLPKDRVPECGPDLAYMLENFPLSRTIVNLFQGSGECAEVDWTFLGLSIAEWSLLWFVLLAIGSIWIALRRYPRPAGRQLAPT